MARKPSPQAITAKMYRHFAVITVALTLTLALFADGENRQAVAEEVERVERENELARAEAEKLGAPKLFRRAPEQSGGGSFGPDTDASYGAPMDNGGGNVTRVQRSASMPVTSGELIDLGLSEEELAALTPEQLEELLEQLRASRQAASSAERESQVARLLDRSRSRSGVELAVSD